MEPNTTPVTPVAPPVIAPITNIFKGTTKTEPVVTANPVVLCTNCEDSGKTCSVCGFDRE